MYILKNAGKSIVRTPVRNILIGIIMAIILLAASAGFAILSGAKNAEELGKAGLRIDAQIVLDRSTVKSEGSYNGIPLAPDYSKYPDITLDQYRKYAKSPNVDALKMYAKSGMSGGESLHPIDLEQKPGNPSVPGSDPDSGSVSIVLPKPEYAVYGYSSFDMISDLASGTMKMIDGELFDPSTADYRCIISRELAEQNGIQVGDPVRLVNPYNDEEGYNFTVCGIYTTTANGDDLGETSAILNTIYTSYPALREVLDINAVLTPDREFFPGGPTFPGIGRMNDSGKMFLTFKNEESYNAFCGEVYDMGLDHHYIVTSDNVNSYQKSLVPLQSLSRNARIFLAVVLVVGLVILVVMSLFSIRERKYEVGVYIAMGMRKSKVALQFALELLMVATIALVIGTSVGTAISEPLGREILSAQVEQAEKEQDELQAAGAKTPETEFLADIDTGANLSVILMTGAIALLITFVTSIGAVVMVVRYEPLKILSERA